MTDKEIIKALECCANYEKKEDCIGCPIRSECEQNVLEKYSLELITRQQAEIEQLTGNLNFVRGTVKRQLAEIDRLQTALFKKEDTMQIIAKEKQQYFDELQTAKSEIERLNTENNKNFDKWNILEERTKKRYAELYQEAKSVIRAEAVKEFVERLKDKSLTKWDYHDAVDIEEIDNLIKEMVGDKE